MVSGGLFVMTYLVKPMLTWRVDSLALVQRPHLEPCKNAHVYYVAIAKEEQLHKINSFA